MKSVSVDYREGTPVARLTLLQTLCADGYEGDLRVGRERQGWSHKSTAAWDTSTTTQRYDVFKH